MTSPLEEELREALKHFSLEKAEALSAKIHDLECKGLELTRTEDHLWQLLTEKIQLCY